MTQWNFDDDDDAQEQEKPKGNSGGLRAHVKRLEAENAQLKADHEKAAKTLRQRAITDVVTSKGLDKRIAAFVPSDLASAEDVEKWLGEFGDLFGTKETASAPEGEEDDDESETELAAAHGRMNKATSGATSGATKDKDLLRRLNDPNLTQDQLLELIASGGATG